MGLEPTTTRLRALRSTDWARRADINIVVPILPTGKISWNVFVFLLELFAGEMETESNKTQTNPEMNVPRASDRSKGDLTMIPQQIQFQSSHTYRSCPSTFSNVPHTTVTQTIKFVFSVQVKRQMSK